MFTGSRSPRGYPWPWVAGVLFSNLKFSAGFLIGAVAGEMAAAADADQPDMTTTSMADSSGVANPTATYGRAW